MTTTSKDFLLGDRRRPTLGGTENNKDLPVPQDTDGDSKTLTPYASSTPMVSEVSTNPLREWLAIVYQSRLFVTTVVTVFLIVGLIHALTARPVYEADALLQVKQKGVGIGAMADFSENFDVYKSSAVTSEIEIIKSRMVLGRVVDELKLDTAAAPVYFPILGRAVARITAAFAESDNGWLAWGKYAWGGEKIQVDHLDVSADQLGRPITLVAGEGGRYQLLDAEENLISEGVVWASMETALPAGGWLELLVSELKARPGTHFTLTKKPRLAGIEALKGRLAIAEQGKKKEDSAQGTSGLLRLALQGGDPEKITAIVNAIAETYLRQNVERQSADVERTLEFLGKQLAVLKGQMETSEAALNDYRQKQNAVDLDKESNLLLDNIVAVETHLSQLNRNRKELLQQFTPAHSRVLTLDAQIASLNNELDALGARAKQLPATQRDILRLARDVKVNTELYTSLLNKGEELRVLRAGTEGNVHILDRAVTPYMPARSSRQLIIALYLLLGLLVGLGLAFLRKHLRGAVEDPDIIEQQLGIPVLASVPHSKRQRKIAKGVEEDALLAAVDSTDPAIESLRSLRTSCHYALPAERNKVFLVTGPRSGVGKSFLAANLGAVMASGKERVLLIDADLRRGNLNELLGMSPSIGLSDVLSGKRSMDQVVRVTGINNLNFVAAGNRLSNPSELLMQDGMVAAIESVSAQFDRVIIDSPPVLAVTDAAIISRLADASLLVVKSNLHPLREIEQSARRLREASINFCGVVFNDVEISGPYGYGSYYGYARPNKA